MSLLPAEQQFYKRKTRKRAFLQRMERLVPRAELEAVIEPYYPKGQRGWPPVGLGRMLRMDFLQQWFNLSDEATKEALYDIPAFAAFMGIDVVREGAPDATILLKSRRRLERHELIRKLFKRINADLAEEGLMVREETLSDTTIIEAPSSTKNAERAVGHRTPIDTLKAW